MSSELADIAHRLNVLSQNHPIGRLQEMRTEIKGLGRTPGRDIFSAQTIFDDYAFHHGGRSELQFNIGIESIEDSVVLRHGVAFSFETSRSLPSIEPLVSKVVRSNEYLRMHSTSLEDMRMWHWRGERSSDYMVGPIMPEIVAVGVFFFMGKLQPMGEVDCEVILADFDRLLSLYRYVEGRDANPTEDANNQFGFRPGCTVKASRTTYSQTEKVLDVQLRHNRLQKALYDRLVSEYGADQVGTEIPSGVGTKVDAVARVGDEYWFYEIKIGVSVRGCFRQAIGQLLEYSFWPGAQEAARLIIVGEGDLDSEGRKYLDLLNNRFGIPITYESMRIDN